MEPFSHKHPLVQTKVESSDLSEGTWCDRCGQRISGFAYSCQSCKFIAHKLCAILELPKKITHPLDPADQLSLHSGPSGKICHHCQQLLISCCSYRSQSCDLCLRCAVSNMLVQHNGHPHPLHPVLRSLSCDACGIEHDNDKGFGYGCSQSACCFYIHEDCASLPPLVSDGRLHEHTLFIYYSTIEDAGLRGSLGREYGKRCQVCKKREWRGGWFYYCPPCFSYVHLHCMPKTKEGAIPLAKNFYDPSLAIRLPWPSDSPNMIGECLKMISGTSGTSDEKLNHKHSLTYVNTRSAHEDELIPSRKTKRNYKVCDACVLPILDCPFYKCDSCDNFLLHKWCAELPNQLWLPFFDHPFSLECDGHKFFECYICSRVCNGFAFTGSYIRMDVKCACLPKYVTHEAHKHPILLKNTFFNSRIEGARCDACDQCIKQQDVFYICVQYCHFYLHWMCGMLPHTVRHRYDDHHFTLYYSTIQDGPNEYVCELCEDVINPTKCWFYHCAQCDQSLCIRCVYSKGKEFPNINLQGNLNIKFGVTYNCENYPHPLSLFEVTYDTCIRPICKCCEEELNYNTAGFKCEKCSIVLCATCSLSGDKDRMHFLRRRPWTRTEIIGAMTEGSSSFKNYDYDDDVLDYIKKCN